MAAAVEEYSWCCCCRPRVLHLPGPVLSHVCVNGRPLTPPPLPHPQPLTTPLLAPTPSLLLCRYDNEYGYSARFVDVAAMVARSL